MMCVLMGLGCYPVSRLCWMSLSWVLFGLRGILSDLYDECDVARCRAGLASGLLVLMYGALGYAAMLMLVRLGVHYLDPLLPGLIGFEGFMAGAGASIALWHLGWALLACLGTAEFLSARMPPPRCTCCGMVLPSEEPPD